MTAAPGDGGNGPWTLTGQMQRHEAEARRALSERPPFPADVMIELSNACNHACVFCANPKMTRPRTLMDAGLARDLLGQARTLGATRVGFYTTGDPFVHKDLAAFVAHAKELGFEYTYISTNGALATPQRVRAVIDAGLDSIKFSINAGSRDSYRRVHGSDDWDRVLGNLRFVAGYRTALGRPLYLGITFVVIDQNRHEAAAFRAAFAPLVDDIYFSDCDLQQGYMDENRQLLQEGFAPTPIAAPCSMLFSRAHVTCEGYLTLCCVDYQNYLAVADLKRTSLADAWWSELFVSMRRRHLEDSLVGTLCHNCIKQVQDPIEPLDPALASPFDFGGASRGNQEKQRGRFVSITVGGAAKQVTA